MIWLGEWNLFIITCSSTICVRSISSITTQRGLQAKHLLRELDKMSYPVQIPPICPRITIVGAGVAGLATALFLRRLDFNVTVLESRPHDAADGGYIALAPNAAFVLDQLGLYQDLQTQGNPHEEFYFLSASRNLSKIGSVLNGSIERYGYPCLRISRHIVRQTLLDAVLRAGVEVKFEHKLTQIDERKPGEVTAFFSTDQGSATMSTTSNFLIASDGIHSRTRQILFPESPLPTFTGQMGLGGGQIPRTMLPAQLPLPCLILGSSNSFMLTPTNPNGTPVNCSATVEVNDRSREEWAQLAADKGQLKYMLINRHCGGDSTWPEVVQKACQSANAESLTIWPYYTAPILDTWISPTSRVILTGDAAHAMPPTGGQGAAMALEDAATLSSCFAKLSQLSHLTSVASHLDLSSDLAAWQAHRQERVTKVREFTSRGGDIRKATPGHIQMMIKESLMWGYFHVKGKEGGYSWLYGHRAEGPSLTGFN